MFLNVDLLLIIEITMWLSSFHVHCDLLVFVDHLVEYISYLFLLEFMLE